MSSVTMGCTEKGDLQVSSLAVLSPAVAGKSAQSALSLGKGACNGARGKGGDRRDGKQQGKHGGEKCSGSLPKEAISLVRSCWLKLRIAKVSSDKASGRQ